MGTCVMPAVMLVCEPKELSKLFYELFFQVQKKYTHLTKWTHPLLSTTLASSAEISQC